MDENHRDGTGNNLIAREDTKWVLNKKKKLWIPEHKKRTGFEDKTRWDWLQLILQTITAFAIPLSIIALINGVQQFNVQQQTDREKTLEQQQADRTNLIDQQQQTTLQNYLGSMSDLLLKENLLRSKPNDVVRQVAEAQTLTALQNLNPARKAILVKFLYESRLIFFDPGSKTLPIIPLFSADLRGADLRGADLRGADLDSADLRGADLDNALLNDALLNGANLSSAALVGADLRGADLRGAKVTQAQLNEAKSLQGTGMPDGSTHP